MIKRQVMHNTFISQSNLHMRMQNLMTVTFFNTIYYFFFPLNAPEKKPLKKSVIAKISNKITSD